MCVADIAAITKARRRHGAERHNTCMHSTQRNITGIVIPKITEIVFRLFHTIEDGVILVVGIITFAWSTILGWSYYGERCAQYLWGKRALLSYKLVFVAVVVVGPVLALDLVWTIADILNALMAIPNLVAVLLLSGVVARETRHYLGNLDEVDQTEIPRVDK